MTANETDVPTENNSGGQDGSIDHKLPTDGGVSPRRSIGADSSTSAVVVTELNLAELIGRHENMDCSEIPGVSAAEAAAWTTRLIEARDAISEGGEHGAA